MFFVSPQIDPKGSSGLVAHLKMFIPLLLNQRVVLNSNCVPHIIFLEIITSQDRFSENLLVIIIRLTISDIETGNLSVFSVCKNISILKIFITRLVCYDT